MRFNILLTVNFHWSFQTSNAVASILYQLSQHDCIQEKLYQSLIREGIVEKSNINIKNLQNSSYLKACIKETMRYVYKLCWLVLNEKNIVVLLCMPIDLSFHEYSSKMEFLADIKKNADFVFFLDLLCKNRDFENFQYLKIHFMFSHAMRISLNLQVTLNGRFWNFSGIYSHWFSFWLIKSFFGAHRWMLKKFHNSSSYQ